MVPGFAMLINLPFVLTDEGLRAIHCRLFLDREHENEIASCLNLALVKGANGRQKGFDITRVVSDAGRVNLAIAYGCFYLQSWFEDGIEVRVKDDRWTAARASAHRDEITCRVIMDVIEVVLAQEAFDVFRTLLLLARRRIDFRNRNPFPHDAFMIMIEVGARGFEVCATGQGLDLLDVLGHAPHLRERGSHYQ